MPARPPPAACRPGPEAVRPAAVLFDCDGVLADSEGLVNAIIAEDLTARGWRISAEQARETFLGMASSVMRPMIEARVGPLPADWLATLSDRIAMEMAHALQPIPGALAAVAAVRAAGVPVAVASNSARKELLAKLERIGLAEAMGDRVFSYEDVARPKPAPDLYLAAAEACGAAPADCVVVEDSLLGARAGIAAGCRVLGLTRETDASIFSAIGAVPFAAMADLPQLLALAAA